MDFSRPRVMAILNVTPDSFVPGTRAMSREEISRRVRSFIQEGADIIDIGGYSSRPGAVDIKPEEEYSRLCRGLEVIREIAPEAVISVDTFRASIAEKCVREWNVSIINDTSGGRLDPEMDHAVAELNVTYILMHSRGNPESMQSLTDYSDVTAEVIEFLAFRIDRLRELGVNDIIIDPGFGFAKTTEQNYQLLDDLQEFKIFGLPLLAALSRKSMIWRPLGITPEEALTGTVVLDTVALMKGADIIRVHDVCQAMQTIKLHGLLKKSQNFRSCSL